MVIIKDEFYAKFWAFTTLASLLFNTMFGSITAVLFLLSGTVLFMSNVRGAVEVVKRNWFIFLLPVFATLSFIWSDVPMVTLRGGIQLILTTLIAVLFADRVSLRLVLQGLLFAFLIGMLMCLFSSRYAHNGMTGEISLIGIFDSKNYLALNTAMSIFVSIAIACDKTQRRVIRAIGVFLLFVSFAVLIKAKSMGSLVFVILAISLSFGFVFYQNLALPKKLRYIINTVVPILFITLLSLVIFTLISGGFDEFMLSVGKDPTLTGRTYIWARGVEVIRDHFIFGVGFQSLFYVGNDVAEDIWEALSVPSGSGFNFHNMYVDTFVELGFIGIVIFISLIVGFFKRITSLESISLGSKQFYATFVFLYMFLHTFLEAGWLGQFTVAHLLTCIAWVYLREGEVNEE